MIKDNYFVPILTEEQMKWVKEAISDYNIIYLGYYGSHLYGLARPESDIDIKGVYIPTKTDLLRGKNIKVVQKKNEQLDIEIELKSVGSFLNSSAEADTNCFDMLHTPEEFWLITSYLWENMVDTRDTLYAKNMKGIIGYIKTHTAKYSHKIDRYNELAKLKQLILEAPNMLLCEDSFKLVDSSFKYIKPVTLVTTHEQQYLDVCGKKIICKSSIHSLLAHIDNEMERYGKRTTTGVESGVDAKSLSHSLRVLYQLKDIIEQGEMKLPLTGEALEFTYNVKRGIETNRQAIIDKIDTLYETCMEKLEKSNLQDYPDISKWEEMFINFVFEETA